MKIYCLTVIYNQKFERKFQFLKDYNFEFEEIVFDNSTIDEIKESSKSFCDSNDIIYESLDKNVGLPKAYNFIIKKYLKDDDWIIILDQDTVVTKEYFDNVVNILSEPKSLAYFSYFKYGKNRFGPKIIANPRRLKVKQNHEFKHLCDYLIGINSCSLFSKEIFNKIGYFNEDLFLDYVDNDFCFRLANYKIKSETIDLLIEQKFFSKEKATYSKVKNRYQNQKNDGYIYHKQLMFKKSSGRLAYFKEKLKFAILYSMHNNLLWFLPLIFSKKKGLGHNL